jgi:hypothetical protein
MLPDHMTAFNTYRIEPDVVPIYLRLVERTFGLGSQLINTQILEDPRFLQIAQNTVPKLLNMLQSGQLNSGDREHLNEVLFKFLSWNPVLFERELENACLLLQGEYCTISKI